MDPQNNIPSQPIQPEQPIYQQQSLFRLPLIIGGIVLLFIVGIGVYYLGTKQLVRQTTAVITPTSIPIQIPKASPTTVSLVQPTQTLTIPVSTTDWLLYDDGHYSFKYPGDWSVETQYTDASDLSKGYSVKIMNPKKSVILGIYLAQPIYGFAGPNSLTTKKMNIVIDNATYAAEEINGTFVDFKITKEKDYFFLFGTGYPTYSVNDSKSDYESAKNTILTMLSTFKFIDLKDSCDIKDEKLCQLILLTKKWMSVGDFVEETQLGYQLAVDVDCNKNSSNDACYGSKPGVGVFGYKVLNIPIGVEYYRMANLQEYLKHYFLNSGGGQYYYKGTLQKNNKAAIVFTSKKEVGSSLFAFMSTMTNGEWSIQMPLLGKATNNFLNLDESILTYIQ